MAAIPAQSEISQNLINSDISVNHSQGGKENSSTEKSCTENVSLTVMENKNDSLLDNVHIQSDVLEKIATKNDQQTTILQNCSPSENVNSKTDDTENIIPVNNVHISESDSTHVNNEKLLNSESETEEGVIEVISSTCWYVSGQLSGLKTDLLIDSGSSYTVMDRNLFLEIPEKQRPSLNKINLVLRSATGEKLKIFGQANMEIQLGSKKFATTVKVVSLGEKTAILGLDFMESQDCTINMGKGIIRMEPDLKLKLHRKSVHKCARIQASENVCIPPHHEMIITGKINQKHRQFHDSVGAVEPTSSLTHAKGLFVAKALVNTEQNIVPVKLANFTDKQIQLDKGYTIAMLHPVQVDKITEFTKTSTRTSVSPVSSELPEHLKPMLEGIYEGASETETEQVKQLLIEYQDCFMAPDGKLGRTSLVQFEIDTGDNKPVRQKLRLPPMHIQEAVDREIDKMLADGIMEPCQSPWASNLVCVQKKTGEVRLAADFRQLNACLVNNSAYPLPKIDECLDTLSGSAFYSTLDMIQGYNQLEIKPSDREKTSIITKRGQFQYTCMPFGISSSPGCFELLMETVLAGLQWEKCVIYLDDVLTFSKTFSEGIDNLKLVLDRFRKANLKLKPSKCFLMQTSVKYLGHVVDKEGIHCDPDKIECVKTWPRPTNLKESRSFVGFCQYYRKHIANFSELAAPLFALTRKRVQFDWTEQCERAFNTLKEKLINSPVLAYANKNLEFILDTDASLNSVGGVLSQIDENGDERPLAYASKTLSKSQTRYCTTMRELLAAVLFIKHFHHYLYYKPFTLRVDHASLTWLTRMQESSGLLARWITTLSSYKFKIVYRKGSLHANSDALSRLPPIPGRRSCKRPDCPDCALAPEDCVCLLTSTSSCEENCVCALTRSQARKI